MEGRIKGHICKAMPKVRWEDYKGREFRLQITLSKNPNNCKTATDYKKELHAHLNGSITQEMLSEVKCGKATSMHKYDKKKSTCADNGSDGVQLTSTDKPTLAQCWVWFGKIHELITTPEILYWVTCQVIKEFALDRVIYLELRTTPKKIHQIQSKDIYIENVLKAIIESSKELSIVVKLLISVDRKQGEVDGLENVQLAHKWSRLYPHIMVGIDVSGDPNYGNANWICPLLQEARTLGLKISCHLPEIVNVEETMRFMDFAPDRLAHGQYLHPLTQGTEELWNLAKAKRIPMETCITSDLISGMCPSLEEHYVQHLHAEKMPFIICTDDCGVFKTSLSSEYKKFLDIVPLSVELRDICLRSVSYAFASPAEKETITLEVCKWWEEYQTKIKK